MAIVAKLEGRGGGRMYICSDCTYGGGAGWGADLSPFDGVVEQVRLTCKLAVGYPVPFAFSGGWDVAGAWLGCAVEFDLGLRGMALAAGEGWAAGGSEVDGGGGCCYSALAVSFGRCRLVRVLHVFAAVCSCRFDRLI
ncbi:hypothetical protein QQ045_015673 [Rhodiola kirilowii]